MPPHLVKRRRKYIFVLRSNVQDSGLILTLIVNSAVKRSIAVVLLSVLNLDVNHQDNQGRLIVVQVGGVVHHGADLGPATQCFYW